MNKRVMFVDDEPNVLSAIRRALRGKLELTTCNDPLEALHILRADDPFAVIVSDMRMPGMDGVEFLSRAKEITPDSVRLMLTGNADQKTAVAAVNDGEVFKFLNKPCDPELLQKSLVSALRQYQLITAEKELLCHTLNGSIKVLAEVLSIVSPEAFGRTDRIRTKALEISARLDGSDTWELDTAASLCLLGCVGLRSELLEKVLSGEQLNRPERDEYMAHPLLSAELVTQIPRMEGVADILLYQHKHFDGSGFPRDDRKGESIPIGARILHVVLDFDNLKAQGWSDVAIYEQLSGQTGHFDPNVLRALHECMDESSAANIIRIPATELKDGMKICDDVKTSDGVLLVCQGQEVTAALRKHLLKFVDSGALDDNVLVTAPDTSDRSSAAA